MEGRFLGSRVWGENERGELGHEPSWARGGEGVVGREREESDLNDVGPKNDLLRLDRSDRLPVPVRPVRPRLTGGVLVLCFVV